MIFDGDGNELTSLSVAAFADSMRDFALAVDCRAGYWLSAIDAAGVEILAKASPGDAFQNLATDPIDLTSYAGTRRTFNFRVAIADDAMPETFQTSIVVAP